MARLTETQRRELWLEDKQKVLSVAQLCAKYGVSRTTLANIRRDYTDKVATTEASEVSDMSPSCSEASDDTSESFDNSEQSIPEAEGIFNCTLPAYLDAEPSVGIPT